MQACEVGDEDENYHIEHEGYDDEQVAEVPDGPGLILSERIVTLRSLTIAGTATRMPMAWRMQVRSV